MREVERRGEKVGWLARGPVSIRNAVNPDVLATSWRRRGGSPLPRSRFSSDLSMGW